MEIKKDLFPTYHKYYQYRLADVPLLARFLNDKSSNISVYQAAQPLYDERHNTDNFISTSQL